jgi:2-succinyl-6-hydroxy-2,4-cyclohexadiene-1-carboxylate synthase
VLVNGVNLNVKKVGSGPPIVALHGFTGSMSTWTEFARAAKKEFTLITIDLLGHGDSDIPLALERYRLEHSIADTSAVLEKLGVSRACWLGYSLGGRIALAAAALNPSKCRCLVLEGASPGLLSSRARARRKKADEALAFSIRRKGVEAFVNYWEQLSLFDSQRSLPLKVREHIRKQRLRNSPIGLANTLRAANPGVQPPIHRLLTRLKFPVLCIAGEYDNKFRAIATQMCNKMPNGQLSIIRGAGHATHIEKPREFNKVVLNFLRESLKANAGSKPRRTIRRSRPHHRV